jgi:hypothetical protein
VVLDMQFVETLQEELRSIDLGYAPLSLGAVDTEVAEVLVVEKC